MDATKFVLLALSTWLAGPAAAQRETIYLAGPGGGTQKLFQERILPAFKSKTGYDVAYIPGNSTDILTKLQSPRGRQDLNVVIIDDGPMYQAIQAGYCAALANAPIYSDVYQVAHFGNKAMGIGLVATGIAYNKSAFDKNHWPAPRSWMDLTDPRFKQRFTTSSLTGTYGVHTLVMFARANGGSEANIDPGFNAIAMRLAPNVSTWSSSPAALAEMFQNKEVDVAVWGSSRAYAMKKSGFPMEFVYPREGAAALVSAACVVNPNGAVEASQALVQHLVSPQVQQWLSSEGWGPTNSKLKLEGEVAANVPYGPEQIKKLVKIDWKVINQRRAEWTNRWNRTIER